MATFEKFQADVLRIAKQLGYDIGYLRGTTIPQIDFGYKKLHGNHLRKMYPDILNENININKLIEKVAPGRPCTHLPVRKIIMQIKKEHNEAI